MIPFKNIINDAYCRDISVKIRSQLQIKRQKGDFISPFASYGYCKSKEDKHRLEIDDYAASVVRDIFNWNLDGVSQQKIARKLNEKGILSPMDYKRHCGMNFKSGFQVNAESKWSTVTIGRILKNEIYIGVLEQGKKSTPNHKVKRLIEKPKDQWVRIENNHDAIIQNDIFQVVNHVLLSDTRVAQGQESVYLLSGLLFCGDCGKSMVRNGVKQNGKMYSYYMCSSNRNDKSCSSHRISETKLTKAILKIFKQHVANMINMEILLEYINTLPFDRNELKQTNKLMDQKTAEIERYHRLKTKLYESMVDGLIDKNEYLDMKCSFDEKLCHANEILAKLKTEYISLCENTASNNWIEDFKRYKDINELTRAIVVTLIDKITVYDTQRVDVSFKYQDKYERVLEYIENIHNIPSNCITNKEVMQSDRVLKIQATERGVM